MPSQNLFYQRGLRKVLSTPTEVRAIPTTEETTMTHVGGQAKEEAGMVAKAQGLAFRRKRLADVVRFGRKQLSVEKKQGKRATAIQLGNLALTGYGGYRNIQQQKEIQTTWLSTVQGHFSALENIKRRHLDEIRRMTA